MSGIIECVPNFSEGRNMEVIKAITDAITSVEGITLLDVDPGADTNRTVVTFVGDKSSIVEAAFRGIKKASELIDMRNHRGAHPRIGATDVCPLVPVSGVSLEECVELSHQLAKRVAEELGIPVYLYEKSAQKPDRVKLENIREGQYEGLPEKLKDPEWKPDYGEAKFNPRSGATVIGVRDFLIAYNVNLNTRDRKLAHDIALTVRERGRLKRDKKGSIIRDKNGNPLRQPGILKGVKAVGWYIDEYKLAQVSMNITNYKVTPLHVAFEEVCKQAEKRGLRVTGSEIVGLVPKETLLMAGRYFLEKQGKCQGVPEDEIIRVAIQTLGLNEVAEFDPDKKIIEYRIKQETGKELVNLRVKEFVNEVSTDSPAPGGGSVSALVGALASALSSMVANLTYGKKGYERHSRLMNEIAIKSQEIKDKLLSFVDRDTEAFNKVMDAMRLPKKTEEEKKERETAIQEATKYAAEVPLSVMKTCVDLLDCIDGLIRYGNVNSISDAGVAGLMARACIKGAGYNVLINAGSIEDKKFVEKLRKEVEEIETLAEKRVRAILRKTEKKLIS